MKSKIKKVLKGIAIAWGVCFALCLVIVIAAMVSPDKEPADSATTLPSVDETIITTLVDNVTTTTQKLDPDIAALIAVENSARTEDSSSFGSSGAIQNSANKVSSVSSSSIPSYTGQSAYAVVNGNNPSFSATDKKNKTAFERYSPLDSLGRCGVAYANVCREIMPTAERGAIGSVKPSGWHTVKYDCVDGKYLYNRCHLIGYQLSAENANTRNLITGTRYLNIKGMLPFENMVADYVKETNNHVLYRVTPVFVGSELVCRGVQIEAYSVEDNGDGICFNVYCFNVQPGVTINYADGSSALGNTTPTTKTTTKTAVKTTAKPTPATTKSTTKATTQKPSTAAPTTKKTTQAPPSPPAQSSTVYITDTGSKYHEWGCSSLSKSCHEISLDDAIAAGYTPCARCH